MSAELHRRWWRRKRWWAVCLACLLAMLIVAAVYPRLIAAQPQPVVAINGDPGAAVIAPRFRLLSWNLAHGRGLGNHQALRSRRGIVNELHAIAAVIGAADPDLIALQETDAPSWWSGRLSHPGAIADRLGDDWQWVQGLQVDGHGLHYGTAVLSRAPITSARAEVFPAGLLVPAKGATITTIDAGDGRQLTLVSLHLHFLAGARQRQQVAQLTAALADCPRPLIVAGDFNGPWSGIVGQVAAALDLQTWQPLASLPTFPQQGRRLDWILCSPSLTIDSLQVIEADHSDHRAVVADITWNDG